MPLDIKPTTVPNLCTLSSWSIQDHDAFIHALAWIYLQKPLHAARIAEALPLPKKAALPGNPFIGAMSKLQVRRDDLKTGLLSKDPKELKKAQDQLDARISHRDGLLFQHISWLAAAIQYPAALKAPPHSRVADKGFDGIILDVNAIAFEISRLIMCEDKASTDPRQLVRRDVWNEFKTIHAGIRDDEVNSSVTALLSTLNGISPDDLEGILDSVCWKKVRQFRVALAVGPDREKDGGYKHLFRGFDKAHPDGCEKTRYAEVMPMKDVRLVLDEIAMKVYAKLEEMNPHV
ncbi:hypothetical protein [Massilia consociata]|uniref:Uncharacterized protein n=1 Tax=Massilia consociata TaxID=760117 RepID=A0ABV6FGM7_9BURK